MKRRNRETDENRNFRSELITCREQQGEPVQYSENMSFTAETKLE
jgi:hypothetical protein